MKAAVINKYDGEEVLSIEEIDDPKPHIGEVVVQVRCAALNHLDIWVRNGRGGPNLSMPHVLGSDASGAVIEKAPDVKDIREGDNVIINPGLSCGRCEFCLDGQQSQCVSFGIIGMVRPGTFAEKVAVPAVNIYPKPAHLEFEEAAALPLAYVTAWRMLYTRAKLKASDTILINGIGGGVALACLQFAKRTGAEVIVTSSSDDKIEKAKNMGADHGINYKTNPDITGIVRELTSKRGVDLVVTTVGAATWETDLAVVRRGGKIVICGVTTGADAKTNLQRLYWNQITILGSTMGCDEDFRQMLKAVENTKLKPVIDSVYPLGKAAQAMKKMERGEQFGKIVLDINVRR